jgi:hypothetical protein
MRMDITNEAVQKLLDRKLTLEAVARMLGCSYMVVHRVAHGLRKPPGPVAIARQKSNRKKRLCSCCKIKPVAKNLNLRWLCADCWRSNGHSGYSTESPCHIQI